MPKILLINHCLRIGGAEKLLYELAIFAKKNNIKPYILIFDNYEKEYYDPLLEEVGAVIIRTRLTSIFKLRHPVRLLKAILWRLRLKYFASEFKTIQFMNLAHTEKIRGFINHKEIFSWHVVNSIQYPDYSLPYAPELFTNDHDKVIYINEYQSAEIENQYGKIKLQKLNFKLFLN